MHNTRRGWYGDSERHAQAGSKSSGNPNAAQNLTPEARSKGGRASSSMQDMSELGRKGGQARSANSRTWPQRTRGTGQMGRRK